MSNKRKESGAALFMVLVLLAVVGIFGVGALKNGIAQLQMASHGVRFDRAEQSVEAGMNCVIAAFVSGVGSAQVEAVLPDAASPNSIRIKGTAKKGCSSEASDNGAQQHRFNELQVVTHTQFCGQSQPSIPGTDLELFQSKQYLLTAAGFNSRHKKETAVFRQGWSVVVPAQSQMADAIVLEHQGTGQPIVKTQRLACQTSMPVF